MFSHPTQKNASVYDRIKKIWNLQNYDTSKTSNVKSKLNQRKKRGLLKTHLNSILSPQSWFSPCSIQNYDEANCLSSSESSSNSNSEFSSSQSKQDSSK